MRVVMGVGASFAIRRTAQGLLAVLAFLSVFCPEKGSAQDVTFDRDAYYRAVDYCRRNLGPRQMFSPDQMLLSPDRQILCFSGRISENMDVYLAKDLRENGLFVVRSPGGYLGPAIELSDIIRDRHATVVVDDFCFSACASFLLIAPDQTYVLKGALVLWHYPQSNDLCTFVAEPRDGGPRKLQRGPCQYGGEEGAYANWPVMTRFLKERTVDPRNSFPPDTLYVRKLVRSLYAETGVYRDVLWTIHPRYYPVLFKTKVLYEAYPESQEEIDQILERLHWHAKVIYDP